MGKRRTWIIAGAALGVVLLGYAAYALFVLPGISADGASGRELETATATRGDILMTVSGSGELVPAAEVELSFRAGGLVEEVLVEVGDGVQQGQLVACLETERLELAVFEAQIDLQQAEMELEALQRGSNEDEVGDAQADLRAAQLELGLAQDAYDRTVNSSLDAAISARQADYNWWHGYYQDQKELYEAGNLSQEEYDWALLAYIAADGALRGAINSAENEELQADNRLRQAQNSVDRAWEQLVAAREAPLAETLEWAELEVDRARLAYDRAVADLAGARLVAPFDGVVTDLSVTAGEQIGSNTRALVLAALSDPLVLFWAEEADLASIAEGQAVEITFEAWPDHVFDGEIVRVYAKLVQVDRTSAVQAWATVESQNEEMSLLSGMTADVEVIVADVRSATPVPVEALHEISAGEYVVYVIGAEGQLQERPVAVGLIGYSNAQIIDGLQPGEIVSVGDVD
jgi:HlyD family secretion protein